MVPLAPFASVFLVDNLDARNHRPPPFRREDDGYCTVSPYPRQLSDDSSPCATYLFRYMDQTQRREDRVAATAIVDHVGRVEHTICWNKAVAAAGTEALQAPCAAAGDVIKTRVR
jgi:hypothetical protein